MGVHRFAPILALYGESGWLPSIYDRKLCKIRYWNRLVSMADTRLTKKIFNFDFDINRNNWSSDVKQIYDDYGLNVQSNSKSIINIYLIGSSLCILTIAQNGNRTSKIYQNSGRINFLNTLLIVKNI